MEIEILPPRVAGRDFACDNCMRTGKASASVILQPFVGENAMNYGKKVWIFPDAELPPEGLNVIPGHESVIITNVSSETAKVKFTLLYTDKEPVSFVAEVAPMRVRCLRSNKEEDFGPYTAVEGEQYAIMLESNVPIVAQYGRAEPRTVNFYTTPGYCE